MTISVILRWWCIEIFDFFCILQFCFVVFLCRRHILQYIAKFLTLNYCCKERTIWLKKDCFGQATDSRRFLVLRQAKETKIKQTTKVSYPYKKLKFQKKKKKQQPCAVSSKAVLSSTLRPALVSKGNVIQRD